MNELKIISGSYGLEIQAISAPSKLWARLILLFLIIIGFIFPIVILVFAFDEISAAVIIPFLVFWGTSIFFSRLFLWNTFGKEIIKIEKNTLTYYFDYKYFKDGTRKYDVKDITIELINHEKSTRKEDQDTIDELEACDVGIMEFTINNEQFRTQVDLLHADLEKVKNTIIKTIHNNG